jgi:hypothetical protein
MASRSASEKISGSTAVLVVGIIADVTAAAFFLVSSDMRKWLQSHYMTLAIVALIIAAGIITLLNHILNLREEVAKLRGDNDNLLSQLRLPTEHDNEMLTAINGHTSPQSNLLMWLREGFLVTRALESQVRDLENMVLFFKREPRGFDDEDLDAKYRDFLGTARHLLNKISEHMWSNGQSD